MSTLRLATATNVLAFQVLIDALGASDGKWVEGLDGDALEDEVGRFRVWAGNLGALQKGHSSLDYRLRDSPNLLSSVLKLLKELEHNLSETHAVVSGARLPYEAQTSTTEVEDDENDDGFFSEEDESDSDEPRNELKMRFEEVVDIIDNLYKLSVRIRTPSIRSRLLKASSYMPTDPETGVDILGAYAELDRRHVQELLSQLRQSHPSDDREEQEYLIQRLSSSITLRRRHFKYWKRHRDKLGASAVSDDTTEPGISASHEAPNPVRNDNLEAHPTIPMIATTRPTPSQKTGKTLLSGTEATHHHQSLDDIVDTKSVTSYAVTVRDLHGKGIDLPPPPKAVNGDKDFECPYCWIVCPARYGKGRAWKTHLLQDLQPYICTYQDCESSQQLFRSRREWAEHEATHRKIWRCPEHATALYSSHSGLENHLRQDHNGSFPKDQIAIITKIGETTAMDTRTKCPICYASADTEGLGNLQNHIANHLERFATFALPHGRADDSDGASSVASRGSSNSQSLPDSAPTDTSNDEVVPEDTLELEKSSKFLHVNEPGQNSLFAEMLEQLPDESQNRLAMIASQMDDPENSEEEQSDDQQSTMDTQTTEDAEILSSGSELYVEEDRDSSKQAIVSTAEIPTLRSLYQSRRLLQRDQSFAPNDAYNQMISFCHYDLTRLKVDAIVNNAPTNFKTPPTPDSLHHTISQAGGSGLRKEARSKPRVKVGQVELTRGHDLPAMWVIHAVAPTYTGSKGVGKFNLLSACYRSALRMAANYKLKTIAFPCLGTGGCNFPPRIAARIALQEIREYLDSHPKHRPERIIFCVRAAIDEKAYTDFLPVFFPPTHGDLDSARTSDWSADRAALSAQILEARSQLQKALTDMSYAYIFQSQTTACAYDMRRVDSMLISIRNYLLGSKELKRSLGDVNLLCSVVSTACATISEIAERAKEIGFALEAQYFWDEANADMQAKYGFDLSALFDYCWMFANSLDGVLTHDRKEPDSMARARQVLENYSVKQKGQDMEGIRDHLDEIIHMRNSEGPALKDRDVIQVHHIPSVARLYLLGSLEAKPTMAQPSTLFNHTVCLLREDITRLAVDVMVNSTDVSFSGMGTLDHTAFKKGGPGLRWEVQADQIGECKQGDVKVTPGYLLPARHVLHVIPPDQFRKDTETILRGIYRKILHTAVELRATSVAIPCIGTGMLSYPRRDCASLAMEEVRRFLESAEPGNGLDKIIFVVFSPNDDFIYKSFLPVYFPPPKGKAPEEPQIEEQGPAQHQPAMDTDDYMQKEAEIEAKELEMREREARDVSSPVSLEQPAETDKTYSSRPVSPEIGQLPPSVQSVLDSPKIDKQPATSRFMNSEEKHAFVEFESHVSDCDFCYKGLYKKHRLPCDQGHSLARKILQRIDISKDAEIYSKADDSKAPVKLVESTDLYPASTRLVSNLANRSMMIGTLGLPFDGAEEPPVPPEDQIQEDDNISYTSIFEDTKDATSATELPAVFQVEVLGPGEDQDWVYSWIRVHKSVNAEMDIHHGAYYPHVDEASSKNAPYASVALTSPDIDFKVIRDNAATVSLQMGRPWRGIPEKRWRFRSAEAADSVALFELLQQVVDRGYTRRRPSSPESSESEDTASSVASAARAEDPGETSDAASYTQRNQRLRKIKDDLDEQDSDEESLGEYGGMGEMNWNPFAKVRRKYDLHEQIYDYLYKDLRTRPGSYIGQNIDSIASETGIDKDLATDLLRELAGQKRVHNSVDSNTWVISQQTNELPVIEQEERPKDSKDTGTDARADSLPRTPAVSQQMKGSSNIGIDALADQILLRMNGGDSVDDIVSDITASDTASLPMIMSLSAQQYIAASNEESWGLTDLGRAKALELQTKLAKAESEAAPNTESEEDPSSDLSERADATVKDAAESDDIPADAMQTTTPKRSMLDAALQSGEIRFLPKVGSSKTQDYISSHYTRISLSLVDERVLIEAGAEPDRAGGGYYLARKPQAEEVEEWIQRTKQLQEKDTQAFQERQETNRSDTGQSQLGRSAEGEPDVAAAVGSHLDAPLSSPSLNLIMPTPPGSRTPSVCSPSPAMEPIDETGRESRDGESIEQEQGREAPKQEWSTAEAPDMDRVSGWRDGRGAKDRKKTRSNRALAGDIEDGLKLGTARSLRRARMTKEREYNKSSRASADDTDDELEYYDGQEEDYVDD